MAYQTRHIDKKTGAIYVYSVESYWDKEKKAARNKQVCLGRLNEETVVSDMPCDSSFTWLHNIIITMFLGKFNR